MADRVYYSQEAAMQARRQLMTTAGAVAVAGLALGAVAAMLLRPRKKTPQQRLAHALGKSMDTGREMAEGGLKSLATEVTDLLESAHKQMDAIDDRLNELHKLSKKLARS